MFTVTEAAPICTVRAMSKPGSDAFGVLSRWALWDGLAVECWRGVTVRVFTIVVPCLPEIFEEGAGTLIIMMIKVN